MGHCERHGENSTQAAREGRQRDASPPAVRRCVVCLGTVPAPRRKVCSDHCARRRELALKDYRRAHPRSGQ